ncbi:hypothetical protein NPIL_375701 [Nephila pilipes]|uniref:Uncharacterized protein n=1 Tax=Nephila pilipes TaxID=299642 RepID=A0A8X6MVT8_NEPPI|nr:hypothetical protein NPIL_375701 [Nephila pilipes]
MKLKDTQNDIRFFHRPNNPRRNLGRHHQLVKKQSTAKEAVSSLQRMYVTTDDILAPETQVWLFLHPWYLDMDLVPNQHARSEAFPNSILTALAYSV